MKIGEREVAAYAEAMQNQLEAHADRGTIWKRDVILGGAGVFSIEGHTLFSHLEDEVAELKLAIRSNAPREEVLKEAADIGNMAMMVADRYGALDYEQD